MNGTGRNSSVKGYAIGGKTGTSEDGVNTNKYITSFIGVAPIEDPELVMLVCLYNPTGEGGHQGGGIAAPIGAQVFADVLGYLEILRKEIEEEETKVNVTVPDVRGKSIKEAKKELKELDLGININLEVEEIDEETIIVEQLPKPGLQILNKTKVELYF